MTVAEAHGLNLRDSGPVRKAGKRLKENSSRSQKSAKRNLHGQARVPEKPTIWSLGQILRLES